MKKEDLKTKTRPELERMLGELHARLAQLRFDLADKKLKRTSDIHATRVQIARVMTLIPSAK